MKAILLTTLLLTSLAQAAKPQILINSKILSIPVASTVLSSAGIIMDPAGGMQNLGIIDADRAAALLSQLAKTNGVNLLSTPSVTTKDGAAATVEIVREFIYPTEFDPGAVKDAPDAKPITLKAGESISATPVTPTAFEMRPIGIRMEVEPELQRDGSIELEFAPEVTSFEGFIHYDTPMKVVSSDTRGKLSEKILAENQIQQPVFQKLKIKSSVTLQPGQFLLLGGLGTNSAKAESSTKPDHNKKADLRPAPPTHLTFFMIEAKLVRE